MGKFILQVLDYAELFPLSVFKYSGMSSSFSSLISQQEKKKKHDYKMTWLKEHWEVLHKVTLPKVLHSYICPEGGSMGVSISKSVQKITRCFFLN